MNVKKKRTVSYRFLFLFAKLFTPKISIRYDDEKPSEPCVFVSNHAKIYGPVSWQIYSQNKKIWTAYNVLQYPESKEYLYSYILHAENKKPRFFYRMISSIGGKLLASALKGADTITVHFGSRKIVETLHESVDVLESGSNIVIMPESADKYNDYIFNLFDGFISLGKYYLKKTGKKLAFYPSYLCVEHKTILVGAPIYYDPQKTAAETALLLRDAIYALSLKLPPHTPIPFLDI